MLFNGPSGETQTLGLVVPNHAFYQLNYTRIFTFLHDTTARGKNKVFSVCGHLCGQRRFCAAFGNRWKSCKRRHRKALRRFASPYPGYRHGTPKAGALPTAQHPDNIQLYLYSIPFFRVFVNRFIRRPECKKIPPGNPGGMQRFYK